MDENDAIMAIFIRLASSFAINDDMVMIAIKKESGVVVVVRAIVRATGEGRTEGGCASLFRLTLNFRALVCLYFVDIAGPLSLSRVCACSLCPILCP